jgi:hypothetical protein
MQICHIDFRSLESNMPIFLANWTPRIIGWDTCIKKYHFGCMSSHLDCWLSIVDNGIFDGDGSSLTKDHI